MLIVNPLKKEFNGRFYPVFCKIEFDYSKGNLSITGVEAPLKNGNCKGSCGQIMDELIDDTPKEYTEGWSSELVAKFVEVWKEWHLNDMQAGTPKQTEAIKNWLKAGNKYDYDKACEFLKIAGLYEDNGYKYGTAWLKKEVPPEVLKFLNSLPASKVTPAWI